jgi:DNA adenine methylase
MKSLVPADPMTQMDSVKVRPVLKWAGGKTQLLPQLLASMPSTYEKYLEPFIGGGALFFSLDSKRSVIGDNNAELINLYKWLVSSAGDISDVLSEMPITSDDFYRVRAIDWRDVEPIVAAARTIYLNRLCFNGLYRVNKKGQFNVPFGNYKKPNFPNRDALLNAGKVLSNATIVESDYATLLRKYASKGDIVFLDPPYVPISEFSDFNRYGAKKFIDTDHEELAEEVRRLADLGCFVMLTNSNHPLVHELFGEFEIQILKTRRNINSMGSGRNGEDVLVIANGLVTK